ncbi:MAG: hypothetical protein H0U70_07215 [Tatlockia sp.]|nr:hypothetical protein [Tatlockia sp.]MBA3978636.1 hypothetical protein [Nitrosopumilus sp.]
MKTKFEIESKVKNHYNTYRDYEFLVLLNIFESHPDTTDLLEELKNFFAKRWDAMSKSSTLFKPYLDHSNDPSTKLMIEIAEFVAQELTKIPRIEMPSLGIII